MANDYKKIENNKKFLIKPSIKNELFLFQDNV